MRLVEEEAELGFGLVADLGQLLEQLRKEPQEKRGVESRISHQLVGGQNVDEAATFAVGADEVLQRQRRLAEKFSAALVLQDQQLALYGPDGRLRHVAVLDGEFGGMIRDVGEHGAEIFE